MTAMRYTLLLRLAGPMQSWGTQSRFSIRDTEKEPSKSGVIGMLCAALGRPRRQPVDDLAGLNMGIRVEREGILKKDFHTAGGTHRKDDEYGVARASGKVSKDAVLSTRYYLADAEFTVGFESEDRDFLQMLYDAVRQPHWPIFLGRKAFVPDPPVALEVAEGGVRDVLQKHPWRPRTERRRNEALRQIRKGDAPKLRMVFDAPFASTAEVRCDVPISFQDREFSMRNIKTGWLELNENLIAEEVLCI